MEPRKHTILCPDSAGWHRLSWREWGPEDGRPVLCVHYLTGNGTYFDWLAQDLAAQGFRVIVPDMPGRGHSEFLKNPNDYRFPLYISDIGALLAAAGINKPGSIEWIGASMGGMIGVGVAAMANTPVKRLTLVDIGPVLGANEMQQMATYVAKPAAFKTMAEFEKFMIEFRAPAWGPVPDGYWPKFTRDNARTLPDGNITLAYDPAIAQPFATDNSAGIAVWGLWDAVKCPVLVLRGENSNILTPGVAQEMTQRGPKARLETIAGCGHVPSLTTKEQIGLVREWLGQ